MHAKRLIALLFFVFIFIQLFGQTDKVYSITGDGLIGELKSMQNGVFVFDTDYADSDIQIDWKWD